MRAPRLAARRRVHLLALAGWAIVAGMIALIATQVAGWTPRGKAAAVQAVTPYLLGAAFPLGAVALVTRRRALSAVSLAVAIAFVALAWPLRYPPSQAAPAEGATPLRVFAANLRYSNERIDDIVDVIAGLDADVLTFTEYTPEHQHDLNTSPLAPLYPYGVEYPASGAGGTAIWSRLPITAVQAPEFHFHSSAAAIGASDPIAVYSIHTMSPLVSLVKWRGELELLASLDPGPDVPALLIGDLNGGYWHPPFRDLLDAGWRDAHTLVGDGFSNSWPADLGFLPPFTRLDHALVNDLLVVTGVTDIDIPGSDHRGLVITVVRAER